METGKPKEGWSMNMVAFVLSTIVTFIFWSLAVGHYRSDQRALEKTLEADTELTAQQRTLMGEDRLKASVADQVGGILGAILLVVTALTIFIWCWKRGVFIRPGTVLFLTGYTLLSLVILIGFALDSVLALPEFFEIAPYAVRTAPVSALSYLVVVAAIWGGAIAMRRLEDQFFSNPKRN
ncbi:MAG TPA: hypothetical protein VFG04_18765 [Planctomycetaceae bacterium]|jgi:hypothetical protein|nr:hypothetical protein [Planctomycetaceae bacterium]